MSTLAQERLVLGSRLRAPQWAAIGTIAAVALGAATAVSPLAGVGIAIMIGVVVATVLRPASILVILMLSVFVEIISVGGVTISRLIAPVALLVVLVELVRGGATLRRGPQLFWAVAYSLLALASSLWSVSASHTMFGLASLAIALTYMLCFGALLESEQQLRRLLYVLALGSLVVGAWSLASFKGWSIGPSSDSLQGGRAQGGVGDPNFFANLQLVALPLILVLAADTKTRWLRFLLGFTALVALASILSTLSRGGLIALLLVLLLIPLVPARAFFPSPRHKALVMLVIAVGLIALMSRPGFRGEVVNRATTIFSTKQQDQTGSSGGSGREEIWKAARHSISERPGLGLGYAAFPAVSNELLYTTPGINLELIPKHSDIAAHSAFLGTTAELGPFGLFLFVGMILATMLALRRTAVRARVAGAHFLSRVSNAMILSLVGWSLSSVFISTETARPLWIVIGVSLALPKLLPEKQVRTP
jgi:O-antigen ligase